MSEKNVIDDKIFDGTYKMFNNMGAYKRVLLKLSGESLGGPAGKGIDENWLATLPLMARCSLSLCGLLSLLPVNMHSMFRPV